MAHQFLPFLLALGTAVVITVGMIGFSILIAQRSRMRRPMKRDTYESGMPLLDRGPKRISVKFYIVALVFVVLDVEVAFLYPWAVTYSSFLREQATVVLWDMLAFVVLLAFAYVYLWRKGVFDWGRRTTDRSEPARGGDA